MAVRSIPEPPLILKKTFMMQNFDPKKWVPANDTAGVLPNECPLKARLVEELLGEKTDRKSVPTKKKRISRTAGKSLYKK